MNIMILGPLIYKCHLTMTCPIFGAQQLGPLEALVCRVRWCVITFLKFHSCNLHCDLHLPSLLVLGYHDNHIRATGLASFTGVMAEWKRMKASVVIHNHMQFNSNNWSSNAFTHIQ